VEIELRCNCDPSAMEKKKVMSVPGNLAHMAEENQSRKVTRLGDWLGPKKTGAEGYQRMEEPERPKSASEVVSAAHKAVVKMVPVIGWLPKYDWKSNFFYDFTGGATIALICLVQTLAHASIATTKVIQGPYCAFVPPFVYAMLGTSPHASISSGAIAAILLADQLQYFHDIDDRTDLASLLALISGMMLVFMGLCNAAYAVRFLSQSLISGFVTGGSVLILLGQSKNLLGLVNMEHSIGFFHTLWALIRALPETNFVGFMLGLAMLGVLQIMMWIKKWAVDRLKKPGPKPSWLYPVKILTEMKELVLVALSVTFAYLTSDSDGEPIIPVVGYIPRGLPHFQPPWQLPACRNMLETHYRLQEFFFSGFLVALTSFLTTYATSKKQALQHGYQIDAAQEMFALGMAGTCGSFYGSFTPSGSLSRTSLASEVGVKTQMSGLMKIVVVGTALTFLTPILYYLPKAALAAIILRSTWLLVDLKTPRELWAAYKPYSQGGMQRDLVVWWLACLLTIFAGVLYGIGCAVFTSVVLIVKDAAMPRVVTLGRLELPMGTVWRDVETWPEGKIEEGIMVVEFRGPLSFASADHFMEAMEAKRLNAIAANKKVDMMVFSLGSVHDLDRTSLQMLKELLVEWRKLGLKVIVADAKSRVRLLLEQYFAQGENPLLDQSAFMVSLDDAVQLAKRDLAIRQRNAPRRYSEAGSKQMAGSSQNFMPGMTAAMPPLAEALDPSVKVSLPRSTSG